MLDFRKKLGVKPSTSASGSQPSSNTKKDRIRQIPSSTQKNKVEAHSRKVKSSLKNKDCVVQPKGTADMPCRIPSALDNETPKPVVTLVYSRTPRKSKTNGPVSKSKVVQIVLCSEPALHEMTPATISSGLMPNPHPSTPFVPPSKTDWDILFQPMFDELLTPPPSVDLPVRLSFPIDEVNESSNAQKSAREYSNALTYGRIVPRPYKVNGGYEYFEHRIVQSEAGERTWSVLLLVDARLEAITSDFSSGERLSCSALNTASYQMGCQSCYQESSLWAETMPPNAHGMTVLSSLPDIPRTSPKATVISYSVQGRKGRQILYSTNNAIVDSCDLVDTPMVEKSKLDEDKEGKAVNPSHYRGMIDTLLYLTSSRPDLQFAICMCARYQARPTEKHLHAVKRIFRYLKGTVNRGLWYPKDSSIALTAFADADHAGCQDTRRSTSGSMQFLGDRLVSWSSKRQKSTAISSTEAEYIAMSKHIDIRFHFIKEHVENGVIELYFVNTEYQLADIFTKALARERIEFLINKLGMRSFTPETLKQLADEVDE
ncbi:hypothetical protein Tco_1509477 [Tanacetum coccineum]